VARIRDLAAELKLVIKRETIIINSVPGDIDPLLAQEMDRLGILPTATVPVDEEIQRYDLEQKPLFDLPDTARAVMAINNLMDKLLQPENVQMKRG
jgi:CO dehydrogenase maturation factor